MSNIIQGNFLFKQGGSKLQPGIHTEVKFDSVVVDNEFYDIFFEKEGKSAKQRSFTPSSPVKFKFDGESDDDALLRQQQESLSHLMGLYYMMHGEDKTNNLKGDYNALRKQLATELNKKKGFKLNLKVTTDKTETYPDLPKRYTLGSPYFEKWTEGEESTLTFTTKELTGVTAYLKGQMNRTSAAKTSNDDFLPKDEFPF